MEYLWDFILRSYFVLAVLFLQYPVIGTLVYGSMALVALIATVLVRKHWKAKRRLPALVCSFIAVGSWISLGLGLRVLLGTIIYLYKQ